MSYPTGQDERDEADLLAEVARRAAARARDECDYCGGAAGSAPCRFPRRHGCTGAPSATPDFREGRYDDGS